MGQLESRMVHAMAISKRNQDYGSGAATYSFSATLPQPPLPPPQTALALLVRAQSPTGRLAHSPPGVRRTQVQRQADDEGKRAFAEGQGKVKAEKVLTRNPRQAQLKSRPCPPWMTTSAMLQCYSIVRQYLHRDSGNGRINSTRQRRARPCEMHSAPAAPVNLHSYST
jgi:hypothetical protein